MKMALVVLAILMTPFAAVAEETNGKFPLCFKFRDLHEIWTAMSNKDENQIQALLKDNDCVIPRPGIKLSVIDNIGVVYKVRVYNGNDSAVMYTSSQGYDR